MSQATAVARVPVQPAGRATRGVPRQRSSAPRLRVVAPAPRRSFTGLAVLCVSLLAVGLIAMLMLNISIGKGAYALTELQAQQRQLTIQQQALSQQVEDLGAPQNLAAQATKLGMVPAPNAAFVTVPGGKVDGDPAVATAPPKPAKKKAAPTITSAAKAAAKTAKTATSTKTAKKTTSTKSTTSKKPTGPGKKKTTGR